MKILVTGANGQLGNSIRQLSAGYPQFAFVFTDVDTLDICDAQAVNAFVKEKQVDYIINCAAYTAVDKAEDDEALCLRINRDAVRNLGEAARMAGARVIHVSTDYVFDGTSSIPYTTLDAPNPINVYGKSKLAGELLALAHNPLSQVIRTSWIYSEYGNNFVKTMIRLADEGREVISVVDDQIGCPTYAGNLAQFIIELIQKPVEERLLHYSDGEAMSWCQLTKQIFVARQEVGKTVSRLTPIPTSEYPTTAVRPNYSVLNILVSRQLKNSLIETLKEVINEIYIK